MRSEATAAAEHAGKVGLLPSLVRYPRTAEVRIFKFLMVRSYPFWSMDPFFSDNE